MSEPYKIFRGRPLKDAAWSVLVANSPHIIEDDKNASLPDGMPHGCVKLFKKEKYYCNFYIGGAQRHIAKGTLYQCAKFYDYALLHFDKYRVRKAVTKFNFDRADDESEIALKPQISEYLAGLENYLLGTGELVLPEVKSEVRKEKQRARSYKRTIAGTIETWMGELQPYIFEIADAQEEIKKRLTAIEAHLRITQ